MELRPHCRICLAPNCFVFCVRLVTGYYITELVAIKLYMIGMLDAQHGFACTLSPWLGAMLLDILCAYVQLGCCCTLFCGSATCYYCGLLHHTMELFPLAAVLVHMRTFFCSPQLCIAAVGGGYGCRAGKVGRLLHKSNLLKSQL